MSTTDAKPKAKKFEFTPIGYDKLKPASTSDPIPNDPGMSPTAIRRNQINADDLSDTEEDYPPSKRRRISINDTIGSLAILNEEDQEDTSEFDATLPKIQPLTEENESKRNLIVELNENVMSSKPLKQQQSELNTLKRENHILRMKIKSFYSLFNGSDINMAKNIDLLDEINKWKHKCSNLNKEFKELKLKYDEVNLNEENQPQKDQEEESHESSIQEREALREKLNETKLELKRIHDHLETLTKERSEKEVEWNQLLRGYESEKNTMHSEMDKLQSLLITKETTLNELKKQIDSLLSELNVGGETKLAYDDKISSLRIDTERQEKEIKELKNKCSEWEKLNTDLEMKSKNLNDDLRDIEMQLEQSKKEMHEKLSSRERQFQNEHDDNLELINLQKKQIIDLETKLTKLSEDASNVDELEKTTKESLNEYRKKYEEERSKNRDLTNRLDLMEAREAKGSNWKTQYEHIQKDNLDLQSSLKTLNVLNTDLTKKLRDLSKRLNELEIVNDRLTEERNKLSDTVTSLNNKSEESELQITKLEEELDSIKNDHKEEILKFNEQLEQKTSELTKATNQIKTLQKQLFDNIKNSTESKTSEDALQKRYKQIKKLQTELDDVTLKLQLEEENHRKILNSKIRELDNKYSTQTEDLNDQVRLLKKERSFLQAELQKGKEELNALKATQGKEVNDWIKKYNALNAENSSLLNEQNSSTRSLRNQLLGSLEENKDLLGRIEILQSEKLSLQDQVEKLSKSKDAYKETLKSTVSNLNYATRELDTYKRSRGESETSYLDSDESRLLSERYQTMQQKLLNRIEDLEKENITLERRLQERSRNISAINNPDDSLISQDKIDYYKLKFNMEVQQNNDLKVQLDYLNLVLKRIARNDRLNYMKVKDDIEFDNYRGDWNPYNDFNRYPRSRRRLKFKTVALVVLASIRMKMTANKHKWNDKRKRYLERKITLNEDHRSW